MKKSKESRHDKDQLWKEIIEQLFPDFLTFFLPNLTKIVDLDKGYSFLDKELAQISPKSPRKKGYVDKLVKVNLLNGKEHWILVHIEVQNYSDQEFSERMFKYFYRLYEKYPQKIVALAIFTEGNKNYKPDRFEYSFFETELSYRYKAYKILEQQEAELLQSNNPFAMVILTGLYMLQAGINIQKRYGMKLKLTRMLFQKGYDREKIEKLFIFLDSLFVLPVEYELQFIEELKMKGSEGEMYLTWENSNLAWAQKQKARKEGKIEGKIEGTIEGEIKGIKLVATNLLKKGTDIPFIMEVTGLTENEIKELLQNSMDLEDEQGKRKQR